MSSEIQVEPIPGLPGNLPPGETIVWQGHPSWKVLAERTFLVKWLAIYFLVFSLSRGVVALQQGQGLAAALLSSVILLPLGGVCVGLVALLAWLNARSTVYTITTRRIVMRFGVAFPTAFNFPFRRLAAAHVKPAKNGFGDIALELSGPDRIAWLHLWPHARPWELKRAQPMLASIPEVHQVAKLLADSVAAWSVQSQAAVSIAAPAVAEPSAPEPAAIAQASLGSALAQAGR